MNYQTFIINMKRSPERLEFMAKQFKRLGMDFEVQEGVDGRTYDFSDIYDERLSIKYNSTPLTPVEKGCALSHRIILEKALERKLEYALILEDDVELPDNFKDIVEKAIRDNDEGEADWEYLSFNYPTVGLKYIRLWLFLFSNMLHKNKSFLFYFKIPLYALKFLYVVLISLFEAARERAYKKMYAYGKPSFFYRPLYLAGCYLITKKGAEKLLSLGDKLNYTADRIPNIARVKRGLKHRGFVPLLVKQRRDKFTSTLYDYEGSPQKYVYSDYD